MIDFREKRKAERYPSSYLVDLEPGTGVTRNLSTTGVCFTTDKAIEPNVMLRCFIPVHRPGKIPRRLRCEGRVVRANPSENGWDVAIQFTTLDW
ncbi:MAG: PilZ domain-containing protein [Methylobacter sp.]